MFILLQINDDANRSLINWWVLGNGHGLSVIDMHVIDEE